MPHLRRTPPPVPSPSLTTATEPREPPAKPKIYYDKSVQTTSTSDDPTTTASTTSTAPNGSAGGAGSESLADLRARLLAEFEAERAQVDREIADEKRRAAEALAEERRRGLPEPELQRELASAAFVDFLASSSKVVERALSDSYDYLRDYTVAQDGVGDAEGPRVRLLGSWYGDKWARGRSVTGVDWSPKFPELFAASYNKNPMAANEPDGLACVWNLHLQDRPEFVFHSQSDVLSVAFSPFHPNLLIGGTYSGQILLWDTRSRHPNPVLKTPLSASGHTHPVYSLSLVGTQNAHNLISASTDGTVCAWTLDLLARPQETLDLVLAGTQHKTDEVSVTALGFPEGETATFWVGTEEGHVYSGQRYDRAGSKAGLVQNEVYRGHSGPVTSLDFHPVAGPVDLSDLFLTSGVDWTVKLWRAGAAGVASGAGGKGPTTPSLGSSASRAGTVKPLLSFEEANDYVYDVRWHPHHPALFGTVDGAGKFDLWNLNDDTEASRAHSRVDTF